MGSEHGLEVEEGVVGGQVLGVRRVELVGECPEESQEVFFANHLLVLLEVGHHEA